MIIKTVGTSVTKRSDCWIASFYLFVATETRSGAGMQIHTRCQSEQEAQAVNNRRRRKYLRSLIV